MYELLSKYYDVFMSEELYGEWAAKIAARIPRGAKGADLGCGSGRLTLRLQKEGLDVYGMDISEGMLSRAYVNATLAGQRLLFVKGDANSFTSPSPLDFVTANCDVINYIKNPYHAFKKVFEALKEDGIFIFDISTSYKLINILGFSTYSETQDDITYIWKNILSRNKSSVEMQLTFFVKEGETYKKSEEREVQYIHGEEAIRELLNAVGFKKVELYGDGFGKFGLKSHRAHFVAKK